MSASNNQNNYKPMRIPQRKQGLTDGAGNIPQESAQIPISSVSDGMYYEIDYDSYPIPGTGKFVLKSQKIEKPEKDEIRDLFSQMREIAREYRSTYDFSRFFDRHVRLENAAIFYKQGMFMKDFIDDYPGNAQFSQFSP